MPAATGDHLSPPLCHEQPTICSFSGSLRRFVCLCRPSCSHRGLARRIQLGLSSAAAGTDRTRLALERPRCPIGRQARLVALATTKRPCAHPRARSSAIEPPATFCADARRVATREGRHTSTHVWAREEPLWVIRSPVGGGTNACQSQNVQGIAAVVFSPMVRAHLPAAAPCLIAERVASVPLLNPSEPLFHPRRSRCPAPTTKVRCCCFAQVAAATVIVMP